MIEEQNREPTLREQIWKAILDLNDDLKEVRRVTAEYQIAMTKVKTAQFFLKVGGALQNRGYMMLIRAKRNPGQTPKEVS